MALEFRALSPSLEEPLADFFHALAQGEDASGFHPHPLTAEAAHELCHYTGQDRYYAVVEDESVLAYAILRGWDEGYCTPSLGIAIRREARGTGMAQTLMAFLHHAARRRGARQIRLKVYPDNARAVTLYKKLGYKFEDVEKGQLVGILQLEGD